MINFRQVSSKYFISGGWEDITRDPELLTYHRIGAVLDLQYTETDAESMPYDCAVACAEFDIQYEWIPFSDIDTYAPSYLSDIFEEAHSVLNEFEEEFPKHKILVKCGMGTSRSPSALIYHLCKRDSLPYQEVLSALRNAEYNKPLGVSPNPAFAAFLRKEFP